MIKAKDILPIASALTILAIVGLQISKLQQEKADFLGVLLKSSYIKNTR